jgi:hypothetical protein
VLWYFVWFPGFHELLWLLQQWTYYLLFGTVMIALAQKNEVLAKMKLPLLIARDGLACESCGRQF